MAQTIAGIYEIQNKIGAGGGGVVYLGQHLRLKKQVVLKADRRTLRTGTESLRREVDMLKGLSHTYIPQVYDFVQEDGVVYTVMDFIEGESLDKLLARQKRPSQPQIIQWACQLLDALSYLHSRPPHGILHGDIKPANIMLRPDGSVCLIDFNIALALGEDGAVRVGFSRGYASPEHYGVEYVSGNRTVAVVAKSSKSKRCERFFSVAGGNNGSETTELLDAQDNMKGDRVRVDEGSDKTLAISAGWSATGREGQVMLDVRSDIYSLGATLYHLISGRRPVQDALEVEPLEPEVCSPALSAILQKAMMPDPQMRYQTAKEMLEAFWSLPKRDIRVIRHKRRMIASAVVCTSMFLMGGFSAFVGLKQLEQRQTALTLAEYSADSLEQGDVSLAVSQALLAIPKGKSIFDAPVTAEAQKALTDALGVYDLSEGFKAVDAVELPSAPFKIEVSPEGTYFAAIYAYEAAIYDMKSLQKIAVLPLQESALSDVVFLDESRIIYAGAQGVAAYDLNEGKILWTGEIATSLTLSGDRKKVAAIDRNADHAVIYQTLDGNRTAESSFGELHLSVAANDIFADPDDDIFALNQDGSMLAVSFSNGGLIIFNLEDPKEDLLVYESSDYRHFEGGFQGRYFAFSAVKDGSSSFGLLDTAEAVWAGGFDSQDAVLVQAGEKGIYVANGSLLVKLDPGNGEQEELAYVDNGKIVGFSVGTEYVLVAVDDASFSFYDSGAHLSSKEYGEENFDFVALAAKHAVLGSRNAPVLRVFGLESYEEAQLMAYDARYVHDEARVSGNGQTVMLFGYQDFRVYGMDGELLTQVELPDSRNVYDQQFVKGQEDSWLEVVWYDGMRRCYSAADGNLISEEVGDKPEKNMYEEFFTSRYRIESSLHDAPVVYDRKSEKLMTFLEKDSYLTYVTEAGEYIVTEYINTKGERYGILLDQKLQKLAYLPGLCDVSGNMLVFDYNSGYLCQCHIYSLEELINIGEMGR